MTVTVRKVGGSVAVLIPKSVARDMELAAGTAMEISTAGGAIVMRKAEPRPRRRPRRPIAEIAARIKPATYRRRNREIAEPRAVGKELW